MNANRCKIDIICFENQMQCGKLLKKTGATYRISEVSTLLWILSTLPNHVDFYLNNLFMRPGTLFSALLCTFCLFSFSLHAQWTQVTSGTNAALNSVEMINADTVYAGGANVFLKSINGGQTWVSVPLINNANQPINGMTINDLHFFNGQKGVAVGVRSGIIHTILRTVDGGAHWSTVFSQNDPGNWDGGIWQVDFINIMQGWCVGSSGKVRRTLDGGQTWTEMPDVTSLTYLYSVDFADAQVGYLSGAFSFGGGHLMKTTDGGQSWNIVSGGVYYDLETVHPDTLFLADVNYAFRTHDASLNWDFLPIPDEITVRHFAFQNGNSGYILTDKGVRSTQNGGQFWLDFPFPGNNTAQMRDFDWAPGLQKAVAVGFNGRIFRTTNGGGTGVPMAYFQINPIQAFYCKDQDIQLMNPAPAGLWNSTWFVDGAVYSTENDATVSFSEAGSTHAIKLLISNGIVSDTFARTIQIESALDVAFGEIEWEPGAQMCAGGNAYAKIHHPSVNNTYYFTLNGEIIAQQLALDTNTITFQTPFLNADATLKVFVSLNSLCGSYYHEEVLNVQVFPFPNANLVWTMPDNVCVNSQAPVAILNSQPGMRYWLVESGIFTRSDTLEGTGGTLSFLSFPLNQPVDYQIRATNAIGCMNWIGAPVHVYIDMFYLMVDTTHLYGVEDLPVQVSNFTENLGASNWNFGATAQPPVSEDASPSVTFPESGTYPYTYQYQSQTACQGGIQGTFEIFEPAADLNGASCWSQRLLNMVYGYDHILDVKVDPSGNYWVTGATYQQVGFWNTLNLFLNKYDPSGVLLWSKKVDPQDPANSFDYRSSYGTSIAFDESGNTYLSGSYNGDNARVFGVDFTRPASFFASYSQGFLFKLDADGNVLWHSNFQATGDYEFCVPGSVVYHDNRLHLMLRGRTWQMFQPDGNVATNASANAAAWYIAIDPEGGFVHDLPLSETFQNSLLGAWQPELGGFFTELTTFRSPRLLVSPTGKLLVNGAFTGLGNLQIGNIDIEPLDATFNGKNHFVARIDPVSGTCENAFCAFSLQTPQTDFPAWQVDNTGDIYFGFGLNSFPPSYTPSVKIGTEFSASTPNRSYLAKFSENGDLLWQQKHTDQFFNSFATAGSDGIWVLSRFDQSAGFHNPDGSSAGTTSFGGNDLLLSRIDADGTLLGLQHFGTSGHEQPVSLVNSGPTQLGMFSADDLNQFLSGPENAYTLRVWSPEAEDCPVLSVSGMHELQNWEIRPNPFSESITCTFDLPETAQQAICNLFYADGRVVWSKPMGGLPAGPTQLHFETEQLPAGIYLFEIITERGTSVRKIVKWKS